MNKHYDGAIKAATQEYLARVRNIRHFLPLVNAFEASPDFEIDYAVTNAIRVKPVNKEISAKDLSIALDEILFNLPYEIRSEKLDASDLNIYIGSYPEHFAIYIALREHTKCKVIELSSKAHISTYYDKTYAIVCEA